MGPQTGQPLSLPKRGLALILGLLVMLPCRSFGEDSVAIWGNYYKEESTRVISPMATLRKDGPQDTEFELTYILDNVTSASAAFTPNQDSVFEEFRHEVRAAAKIPLGSAYRQGLSFRYSNEPDYTSVGGGVNGSLTFNNKRTTLSARLELMHDEVFPRLTNQQDTLDTVYAGTSLSQILHKQLIWGAGFEVQHLDGFQANPYRDENHPKLRSRFIGSTWLRYRVIPGKTTLAVNYRFHGDTWEVFANSWEFVVSQEITPWLDLIPRIRYHTQDGVYFEERQQDSPFFTMDPKLGTFDTWLIGLRARIRLAFFADTPLSFMQDASIQPSYHYFDQRNRYGEAHILQAGLFLPLP